ncbi:ATP-binding protein [Methylobacter marinus]|uniref:ATP-binding protein n=1 Tax=Methylobacter marinus TaxID=34058 RepID=UPI000361CE51|nr:DUF87 domain-containing protein [Methylobacter marinus]
MNLFVESLASYLKQEWDKALNLNNGPKEALFILQSLSPENTFSLFNELEEHRKRWMQRQPLQCHFRVAAGLWRDWQLSTPSDALDRSMARLGGIEPNGERRWIDEADRLTYYRNLRADGDNAIVVVLLGFNHATDQGGQADFHRVDELRLWQQTMGRSFEGWVRRLCERYAPEAGDAEIERFDAAIQQLFQIHSLQLDKLAEYLEIVSNGGKDINSLSELMERFYWHLPFWGIPPLRITEYEKKAAIFLKEADAFICHQRFKSPTEQKKAWKKLTCAFTQGLLERPEESDSDATPIFTSLENYQSSLRDFIFDADAIARRKLLKADLLPVLKILKVKDDKPSTTPKTLRLSGLSIDVMLQAVWLTLQEFKYKQLGARSLSEVLASIKVVVIRFNHDLSADVDAGQDGDDLAQELLNGCLGGLSDIFDDIDWRLPIDEDQALQPQEYWEKKIPLIFDSSKVSFGTSRSRPHVKLRIELEYAPGEEPEEDDEDDSSDQEIETTNKCAFRKAVVWTFEPTQPERVRFQYAQSVLSKWPQETSGHWVLPAFRLPVIEMTALYFAADEDEANRLVSQALSEMHLVNLLSGFNSQSVDGKVRDSVRQLVFSYRAWLETYVKKGYYAANTAYFPGLAKAYRNLSETLLDNTLLGSAEVLRRFYKAFLLVDDKMHPNADYLSSAVAWGLTPAVMELTEGSVCFLRDSFPEILCELALGHNGQTAFDALLRLTKIHRPLAGLVVEMDGHKTLSAEIKSHGLLHCLGKPSDVEKSLAVQTLLREEEIDDDDDIADLLISNEEASVVKQVLKDYVRFYPFANDGLRILALHVDELAAVLSGVGQFLQGYLKECSEEWPAFHCTVTVYSTSSSPMVTENRLAAWRDQSLESSRERGRPLRLSIAHRYAPNRESMIELLRQEALLYDVAFLFQFLEGGLVGEIKTALPFQFDYNPLNISRFPICEYPRPIQKEDVYRRQSQLSNRRLSIQTRHADLSARLLQPQNTDGDHLIFGRIDYHPWQPVVEALHQKSQWVACIDPFVDKYMLCGNESQTRRKIVGFASGLGDYGELNLSVSTEQDTLSRLTELVQGQLDDLLPLQTPGQLEAMAAQVVGEAEAIIGLSSLHAVVGEGEKIREVVGFAAIQRALAKPSAAMNQLLPIDAILHWFADSEVTRRPDLLSVSLSLREDDLPLVEAVVIECKFGQQNPVHLEKASEQVRAGLSHLTQLFAPNRADIGRMKFDRRYWWAQLQRAITSRCLINLSDSDRDKLDRALEYLAEGYFEIAWHAAIFTFWTDEPGPEAVLQALPLQADTLTRPFKAPEGFSIWHLALGYQGLAKLFATQSPASLFSLEDRPSIRVSAEISIPVNETGSGKGQTSAHDIQTHDDEASVLNPPSNLEISKNNDSIELESQNEYVDTSTSDDTVPFGTEPSHHEQMATADTNASSPTQPTAYPVAGGYQSEFVTQMIAPVPERLLIGTRNNGDLVYWHYGHPQLNNRHLLIFGASGSGKTYGIQCLLAEMAVKSLHSLIIDYTDGFLPQQTESRFREITQPENHLVITNKLPLNPFRRQRRLIDPSMPIIEETPYQVACRVASIFSSIFDTMGDQQFASLTRALEAGIENTGFTLDALPDRLRAEGSYGESLANKLEPLIKSKPFREEADSAWNKMLTAPDRWVQVMQLSGLSREIQKLVTEFALWDLYDYACSNGSQYLPIPIVLDEIQNLDHRSDSPIDKMLREGRKFGLSLILATQTTSQFNQEQRDRLFQAGHKLFFKPADTEIARFAELLSQKGNVSKNEWGQRLASLQKGQCWSLGPVLSSNGNLSEKAQLVSITSLEDRNYGA